MDKRSLSVLLLAIRAVYAFAQPTPWIRTNGPYGGDIRSVAVGPGNTLFSAALAPGGSTSVYKSTDLGKSWLQIEEGNGFIFEGPLLCTNKGLIVSGASGTGSAGIARSTDEGNTWTEVPTTFTVSSFGTDTSGDLLATGMASGVFRSTDDGMNWSSIIGDLTYQGITCIAADRSGALYAGNKGYNRQGMGVYKSTDGGTHWIQVLFYSVAYVRTLFTTPGGSILAGTERGGIMRSSNGGQSWPAANAGIQNLAVYSFASDSAGNVYAATVGGEGVLKSTDDGLNWSAVNDGLANLNVWSVAAGPTGFLLAGTKTSLFLSTNAGSSWIESASGIASSYCTALAASRSGTIIATTDGAGGIYRTTDAGLTWLPANEGLANRTVLSLAAGDDKTFFAGVTADSGGVAVFRSTDEGASWEGLNTQMRSLSALALATGPGGEVVTASTSGNDGKGIYRSTDDGTTWSALTTGLANVRFYSIAITKSDKIYAGYWGGLPVSTDGGVSWTDNFPGLPYAPIYAIGTDASDNVYAATGEFGVYRLTAGNWILIDQGVPRIDEGGFVSLAFDSTGNVYGGSGAEGVYRLPGAGSYRWQRYNTGLSDSSVTSVCVGPSGMLFAATYGEGVFRNGGGPLTHVAGGGMPTTILLGQNFPNPFNPTTTIRFTLPAETRVTLKVYNILGEEIATLLDEKRPSGTHEVRWDASGRASGVYFYRLSAGGFVDTRKFVLQK